MSIKGAKAAGFTLIEVLVALAVLAITAGFAFRAISGAVVLSERGGREQTALVIAQGLIDRVGHDLPLREGEDSGRTADGFRWQVRQSPYAGSAAPAALPYARGLVVDVTVSWTDQRRTRLLHLSTLRIAAGGSV